MLLDALKDIVKHTNSLGFIEMVKLVGSTASAKIEAIDADKTVVIFGEMYQPIKGIDTTVGLSRISVFDITQHINYKFQKYAYRT